MKKFYLLFAFAAMLFAGGCSDKGEDPIDPVDPEPPTEFTLDVQVSQITDRSCRIGVVSSDDKQSYVMGVRRVMSDMSDDDFIAEDIRHWQEQAKVVGISWLQLLQMKLLYGESGRIEDNLDPGTEYYGWAYAVNSDGTAASKVFKEPFKTSGTICRFAVTSESADPYSAEITITPTDLNQEFYAVAMEVSAYTAGSYTDAKVLKEAIADLKASKLESHKGVTRLKLSDLIDSHIWSATDYYIWLFGVDESYTVDDAVEVHKSTVSTPVVTVTDPCTFTLDFTNVGSKEATLRVVPTDPETTYYIGISKYWSANASNLDRIAENFLKRLAENVDENGDAANWETNTWVQKGEKMVRLSEDMGWDIDVHSGHTIYVFGFDKSGRRTTAVCHADLTWGCIFGPDLYRIDIEPKGVKSREITVNFTPNPEDAWYHVNMIAASEYDKYTDWRKFVDAVIMSNPGVVEQYIGVETKAFACTPDTEYVVYAVGFSGGTVTSDLFTERVHSLPLGEK